MNCADALARYQPTGRGNVFLSCDGFGISYNPAPGSGISMFAADNDDGETAIVTETKFFILNGDFRKEYAAIAHEGLNACLRFFAEHIDIVSSWSASVDDANAAISEQTP